MEIEPIDIAIIGGGPAGVSLCLQLTEALKKKSSSRKITIAVFEKTKSLGLGLPYQHDKEESFCLNLPKQYMLLRPEQDNHFAQWLALHSDKESSFPPRYYFGRYAQEQLSTIAPDLRYELIIFREHELLDLKPLCANQYQLQAQHRSQNVYFRAHYLIFATGHLPNPRFVHLQQYGCQLTPWQLAYYQEIPSSSSLAIVGTRLSAIDSVLKLKQQQHQGVISLFSRSGLLSSVRGERSSVSMTYLVPDNLKALVKTKEPLVLLPALMSLLEQELAVHLPPPYQLDQRLKIVQRMSPLERLALEIQQAEEQQTGWQSVLSCFYQILFKLWPIVPLASKRQFLKQYRSAFISLLCSFPLEKAYDVYEMMRSGQLKVYKGLRDIHYRSPHFLLACERDTYACEQLILALGSGSEPEVLPLYAKLLQKGVIQKHPLGGLSVNMQTYQLVNQIQPNTKLYALGDVIKGACFNMIELGQIVEQAAVITRQIINQLS